MLIAIPLLLIPVILYNIVVLFGAPGGTQGNVINAGVNELVLPNYKQTWANIRKISDAPASVKHLSFKPKEYTPA